MVIPSESQKSIETPFARRNYTLRVDPNPAIKLPTRSRERLTMNLGELLILLFSDTDILHRLKCGSLQVRLANGWVSGGGVDLKLQIDLILKASPTNGVIILNNCGY